MDDDLSAHTTYWEPSTYIKKKIFNFFSGTTSSRPELFCLFVVLSLGNLPDGLWLRLHDSTIGIMSSIPGWGTKIPDTAQCGQKKKFELKGCRILSGITL